MSKYPFCDCCCDEINPKWEDCKEYYVTDNGVMCLDCFKEHVNELLDANPGQIAELLGYTVRNLR